MSGNQPNPSDVKAKTRAVDSFSELLGLRMPSDVYRASLSGRRVSKQMVAGERGVQIHYLPPTHCYVVSCIRRVDQRIYLFDSEDDEVSHKGST